MRTHQLRTQSEREQCEFDGGVGCDFGGEFGVVFIRVIINGWERRETCVVWVTEKRIVI